MSLEEKRKIMAMYSSTNSTMQNFTLPPSVLHFNNTNSVYFIVMWMSGEGVKVLDQEMVDIKRKIEELGDQSIKFRHPWHQKEHTSPYTMNSHQICPRGDWEGSFLLVESVFVEVMIWKWQETKKWNIVPSPKLSTFSWTIPKQPLLSWPKSCCKTLETK